jgi:hypothetical protein
MVVFLEQSVVHIYQTDLFMVLQVELQLEQ